MLQKKQAFLLVKKFFKILIFLCYTAQLSENLSLQGVAFPSIE